MRRRGVFAAEDSRRQGGDVAGEIRGACHLRRLDPRDSVAFPHARRNDVIGCDHGCLGQARRLAQVFDLGVRLDAADPVHQQVGVVESRIGQAGG
jgi:hypothetical protein